MTTSVELRDDYDAAALRALAKRRRDPRQIRRLLALAAVYDGMSRAEAARVGGMDRQTLRDLAHRFNGEGPEGLRDRPRAGRPRRLSEAQMATLGEIVETGPDLATDGVVRWRRIDLKRVIEARFGVVYSERAISDLLAAQGQVRRDLVPVYGSPPVCKKERCPQTDVASAYPACSWAWDAPAIMETAGMRSLQDDQIH
jgi:transposase